MLVKATITESREIKKNIDLPYYSKKDAGDTFFRVNEDRSVLRVQLTPNYSSMELAKPGEYFESVMLPDAVQATPCQPEEVEQAVKKYLRYVENTIHALAETF